MCVFENKRQDKHTDAQPPAIASIQSAERMTSRLQTQRYTGNAPILLQLYDLACLPSSILDRHLATKLLVQFRNDVGPVLFEYIWVVNPSLEKDPFRGVCRVPCGEIYGSCFDGCSGLGRKRFRLKLRERGERYRGVRGEEARDRDAFAGGEVRIDTKDGQRLVKRRTLGENRAHRCSVANK